MFKGKPVPRAGRRGGDELDLHAQQSVLPARQPAAAVGLGSGHRASQSGRRISPHTGSGGNDCGLCLLDDTLYYSTFFGYCPAARRRGLPAGPTA